jgi:hypothetical protein
LSFVQIDSPQEVSQLLKGAGLVVVVMDADPVMVMVAVGVTVQILWESGVPIRVILLLPVQIHLWVMESKKEMKVDDKLQAVRIK